MSCGDPPPFGLRWAQPWYSEYEMLQPMEFKLHTTYYGNDAMPNDNPDKLITLKEFDDETD